jgi:hypothetical protein
MTKVEQFVGAAPPTEEDLILIHPKPGVKVYPNRDGMIVIRNFSEEHSEEHDDDVNCEHLGCSYIRVHPDDSELVAKAIIGTARDLREE